MSFFETLRADLAAHVDPRRHTGVRFWLRALAKLALTPAVQVVLIYRISAVLYRSPLTRPAAFALRSLTVVWGGTEIHPAAQIGPGFCLTHSQMVLVGEGVTIGSHVRMSHGVSIGGDPGRVGGDHAGWPVIGNGVEIGLHAIVLGPVTVGDHAVISAKAMVVKDVPAHAVVAGTPARLVRMLPEDYPKYGEHYEATRRHR